MVSRRGRPFVDCSLRPASCLFVEPRRRRAYDAAARVGGRGARRIRVRVQAQQPTASIFQDSAVVRRRLVGLLIVPLMLMLVLGAALVAQVRALVDAAAWVDHTDEVIATASRLERLCVDMEAGERGYLLMHDPTFRTPYEDGRRDLETVLATLTALVADNPPQRARVDAIRAAIARWSSIADAALARREQPAWQLSLSAQREALARFEGLRREFDALRADEVPLRDQRTAKVRAAARQTTRATIGAALLLGLVLAFAGARQLGGVVRQYGALLDAERERSRALAALEATLRDLNADSRESGAPAHGGPLGLEPRARGVQLLGRARSARAAARDQRLSACCSRTTATSSTRGPRVTSSASRGGASAWASSSTRCSRLSRVTRVELHREPVDSGRTAEGIVSAARAPASPERQRRLRDASRRSWPQGDPRLLARGAREPRRQRVEVHERPHAVGAHRARRRRATGAPVVLRARQRRRLRHGLRQASSSRPSSACTPRPSSRARASASPPSSASSSATAAACGPRATSERGATFVSRFRSNPGRQQIMP